MIGINTLNLNQATINAALEYWLNNVVYKESIQVTSVLGNQPDGYFKVTIKEKETDDHNERN